MIRNKIYLLLILSLMGCSNKKDFILFNKVDINKTQENSIKSSQFNDVKFEYKIIPNDRVSVIVYEHPEFSTSSLINRTNDKGILVNSKGDIRLPLIKTVHIAGLTQTEALNKVEDAFKRYIKSPDIYLEVLNKRAYVIGEVNNPGEVKLDNERVTLLQLISKVGDLKDTADRSSIMILKSGAEKVSSKIINLTDINSLRTANLMIEPNDIVYVLPTNMKAFNAQVNEIDPFFRLIGHILSPFVSIKYLSN